MKKLNFSRIFKVVLPAFTAALFIFIACQTQTEQAQPIEKTTQVTTAEAKTGVSTETFDERSGVIKIDGKSIPSDDWTYITYSLKEFGANEITIDFSCEMKVVNTGDDARLMWQVNISDYPVVAEHTFANGTSDWVKVSGQKKVGLAGDNVFYLSTHETTKANLTIYVDKIDIKVTYTTTTNNSQDKIWTNEDVPSLKETYKDIFDSFGIACEWKPWNRNFGELESAAVRKGLTKHADSITMGNEFKPDSIISMSWGSTSIQKASSKFTASNGKTIDAPVLNGFTKMDQILSACKESGLVMRGHVLVWHSQTPEAFFRENYTNSGKLVDKDTMTARQEYYIKTVLEHVTDWEAKNNDGKHIVWAWDVVNEAMADDAGTNYTGSSANWVRGSTSGTKDKAPSDGGSRWFQIYGSEEFILNAFRFANAYAPADVKLCYNDYNEYMGTKTDACLHLLSLLKNDSGIELGGKNFKARVDVMGMQSHVGPTWPGVSGYEAALKRYLDAGVDVHVTEFDISATSQAQAASVYKSYFNMLKKYGKNYSGANKITNVTVWGISSEDSWISNNGTQYPLLFSRSGSNYYTNSAFDAVISAAK